MSQDINTQLLERASEVITYFEGKQPAFVIERDLAREDLEALSQHVAEGEAIMAQEEIEAVDII